MSCKNKKKELTSQSFSSKQRYIFTIKKEKTNIVETLLAPLYKPKKIGTIKKISLRKNYYSVISSKRPKLENEYLAMLFLR